MAALAASASALGASNTALVGSIESPPLGHQHLALLGMCYGAMPLLYGLLLYQTYWYSRLHSTDTLWLKGLVYGILIFETTQSILSLDLVYFMYHNGIITLSESDPLSLPVVHQWTTRLLAPAMGATIVLCQSFYAYRVYRISTIRIYRLLVAAALIFMICTLGYTIRVACTGAGFRFDLSEKFGIHGVSPNPAIIGFIMLADNCLTGTLAVLVLRDHPSLKRADLFIGHLLGYYVNTGVLISVLGLLAFVFAMAHPGNFIYIGINLIGVKLYGNTVLGVLNSRQSLSDRTFVGIGLGTQAEEGDKAEEAIVASSAEHSTGYVASSK